MTTGLETSEDKLLFNMQQKTHKKILLFICVIVICVSFSVGIVRISSGIEQEQLRDSKTAISTKAPSSTTKKNAEMALPIDIEVENFDDTKDKPFFADFQDEVNKPSGCEQLISVPGDDSDVESKLKHNSGCRPLTSLSGNDSEVEIKLKHNFGCEQSDSEQSDCEPLASLPGNDSEVESKLKHNSGCEQSGCEQSGCEQSGCEQSGCDHLTNVLGSDSEVESKLKHISGSLSLSTEHPRIERDSFDENDAKSSALSKTTDEIQLISNAPLFAGILNPGNRCFLHSMLQMLYHCPDFRHTLAEFLRLASEDSLLLHGEMARDLTKTFETLDTVAAAGPGGVAEFDFGIDEPDTSTDDIVAELSALRISEGEISNLISGNHSKSYSILLSAETLKKIEKLGAKKQSNAVKVKSAIPDDLKSGRMEDPISLLYYYQSFLNFNAFTLNEKVYQNFICGNFEFELRPEPIKLLDLFFPTVEESGIEMADLVAFRYAQSEKNDTNENGEIVNRTFTKIDAPLPANLIVKATRLTYDINQVETKNNSRILNSRSICLGPHLRDPTDSPDPNYNLASFTVHTGDHHYVVVKGPSDKWYEINDSVVTELEEEALIKVAERGYLFMYKRAAP